jgi:RNA recognition motif. (a.k.a. RRM, RBD, or RNP domain)
VFVFCSSSRPRCPVTLTPFAVRICPATAKFKSPPPYLAQPASLPSLSAHHAGPPSAILLALLSATTTSNAAPSPANSTSTNNNGIPSSVSSVFLTNYQQQQGQQMQAASVGVSASMPIRAAGDFGTDGVAYTSGQAQAQECFQRQHQQQLAFQSNQTLGQSQSLFRQQQAQFPGQGHGQMQVTGQSQTQTQPAATEEWTYHEPARAILGNLIGSNGKQLASTDPYNTTVFVGGLSPLVGEDTLRTFFAPFGEIHYVRLSSSYSSILSAVFLYSPVPVRGEERCADMRLQVKVLAGKHCGFVQFVHKADAERAIEKMQWFLVGGSRIRLSWRRSQCTLLCFIRLRVDACGQIKPRKLLHRLPKLQRYRLSPHCSSNSRSSCQSSRSPQRRDPCRRC